MPVHTYQQHDDSHMLYRNTMAALKRQNNFFIWFWLIRIDDNQIDNMNPVVI